MIRVAVYEPGKEVEFREIGEELEDMQAIVGGYIEMLPISRDGLKMICDEEGKIKGYLGNRVLTGPGDKAFDILVGTFFVARAAGEDFASIRPSDEDRLRRWKPGHAWHILNGPEDHRWVQSA